MAFQISPPENINFTTPKEWLHWIKYFKWSKKSQLEPDLTLKSVIAKVQQSELIKKQQPTVRGDEQKIESVSNKKSMHFRRCVNDSQSKQQNTRR